MKTYPLKSVPVFKERLWGGQRLREVFGKDLPAGEKIGESWEIADLPEGQSTVSNGPWHGQALGAVVRRHVEEITGMHDFPRRFPLLIKFLDAQDVLSVQVHPDAETCRRMGQGDPKTECWYIIQAEPGAVIYKGFREPVTRERFAKAIADGTAAELLAAVPVRPGECHFIPAGTVHALGPGLLIAEIQTPSDTTYRVFDWNRVDETGQPRPLHVAEALESIHFDVTPEKLPVTTTGRLVECRYFRVDQGVGWAGPTSAAYPADKLGTACPTSLALVRGRLRVLVFLSGSGTIVSGPGPKDGGAVELVDFKAGDCLLIPAAFEGTVQFDQDTEYLIVTV